MKHYSIVVASIYFNFLLTGVVISDKEVVYITHENVSIGRSINNSMCDIFALAQDKQEFNIISDGLYIDPPCSLYLIGVNNINNTYRFSGMCFKVYDIDIPCGRNDTIVIRGWAVDILNKTKPLSLYTTQSMLITEKTLRCDNKQDFSRNNEFCWEKISMLEILFYSPYKQSSGLTTLTVRTNALIGNLKTSALSPRAMERMTIQMSKCSCDNSTCRPCIPTSHDMYLEFLDRIIAIGSINNYNYKNNNNDKYDEDNKKNIEEESSSVDLNILLPSLFGSITTLAGAFVGVITCTPQKESVL
ncbi:Hypothetical predicted protein [Mytilus galloprovincialis]|uniref:Uncharacterized protein n=1 Tax=Mytilus galloprovincialis TaxID=29158 RepID=A0A8B6GNP8_MYTGA|nr:Hypothetical predicted protein [Mytilus galloprovincialis]